MSKDTIHLSNISTLYSEKQMNTTVDFQALSYLTMLLAIILYTIAIFM